MNNTVLKTFEILQLISKHKEGLTLTQIVKSLNFPKSTVFNIVHSLVALEMLSTTNTSTPVYRLGIEAFKIGLSYINNTSLDSIARPILSSLCHELNETVFMSVRSGHTDLVYIMKYLSDAEYQTISSVGTVRSMLSVSMGKAMLATMPDDEIIRIIPQEMFTECSIPTITDHHSLLEYIHQTRQLGYAMESTAENPQLASPVAAPVLDINGKLVGAISIVIMHDPLNMQRVHELGQKTNATALKISKNLGYMCDDLFSQFHKKS